MINRKTELVSLGLCAVACAGLMTLAAGCAQEEEAPVVQAPPPPPPPPPPAPSVTPIEQLMAEMNIDPRVVLPESKAPDNDTDRRAVLSFFDGFARGNSQAVQSMLPEADRALLTGLVDSGQWTDTTSRITRLNVQCGSSPEGDKCTLAVIEVAGGGDPFQPQLWTYNTDDELQPIFEAQPTPPGIMDRLSGDWIQRWFDIIEQEIALANRPDAEYMIAQRDLDEDEDSSTSGGQTRNPNQPGTLRQPPGGAPQTLPGEPTAPTPR